MLLLAAFLYIKKLDSSVEKTKNAVLNSICFYILRNWIRQWKKQKMLF